MPTRFLPRSESLKHRPGRAAPGLAERGRQRERKALLLMGAEEACDREPSSVRDQKQPLDAEFGVHVAIEPHPDRVERPFADPAVVADLAEFQLRWGHGDLLVGAGGAVV